MAIHKYDFFRIEYSFPKEQLAQAIEQITPAMQKVLDNYGLQLRNKMRQFSPRGYSYPMNLRRSWKWTEATIKDDGIIVTVISELPYAAKQDASDPKSDSYIPNMAHVPRGSLGQESFQDQKYRKGEGKTKRVLLTTAKAKYYRGRYHATKPGGLAVRYDANISEQAKEAAGEDQLAAKIRKAFEDSLK